MGNSFKIVSCSNPRLLELGFISGTIVKIHSRWFGELFEIRGSIIGLRASDVKFLELEKIP